MNQFKNKYYLNDWKGKSAENILDAFEVPAEDRDVNILFATYNYEDWTGDAFVILEKDEKLFEVHAGHCSCYGLEDQFILEETSIATIEHYIKNGYFEHNCRAELKSFIEEYKLAKLNRNIQKIEVKSVNQTSMNYSLALEVLKNGGKVSSKRWGTEGKIYVTLESIEHKVNKELDLLVLVLVDTVRNKAVNFTPSVENQFEDEWYIVDIETEKGEDE